MSKSRALPANFNAKKSPVLRGVSALLVVCFLAGEIRFADAAPVPAAPAIERLLADPASFHAPLAYASLEDVHRGTNGALIVHLQDAHANLSGQENLAGALDSVMADYGTSLVLAEGGWGDCSLTPIKKITTPDVWKKVARRFLIAGKLQGEEYLNLVSDRPMKIVGLEDETLYDASVAVYQSLVDRREKALDRIRHTRDSLARLKKGLYSEALLDYEKAAGRGNEADVEALTAAAERTRFDLSGYPELQKLVELKKREAGIHFDLANLEMAVLLEELSQKAPKETARLAEFSRRDSTNKLSLLNHFQNTLNIAKENRVDFTRFENLAAYVDYLKEFTRLRFDALLEEARKAEDAFYLTNLGSDDAKLVRSIDRFLKLLESAHRIQMTARQYAEFKANEPDLSEERYLAFLNRKLAERGYFDGWIPVDDVLAEGRKGLDQFYELVARRDDVFLENLKKAVAADQSKSAFLITGGYHTENLKQLLAENGYSYVVLTPAVEHETSQKKYEGLLLSRDGAEKKKVHVVSGESKAHDKPLGALDADLAKLIKKDKQTLRPASLMNSGARLAEIVRAANPAADLPSDIAAMPSSLTFGAGIARIEKRAAEKKAKSSEGATRAPLTVTWTPEARAAAILPGATAADFVGMDIARSETFKPIPAGKIVRLEGFSNVGIRTIQPALERFSAHVAAQIALGTDARPLAEYPAEKYEKNPYFAVTRDLTANAFVHGNRFDGFEPVYLYWKLRNDGFLEIGVADAARWRTHNRFSDLLFEARRLAYAWMPSSLRITGEQSALKSFPGMQTQYERRDLANGMSLAVASIAVRPAGARLAAKKTARIAWTAAQVVIAGAGLAAAYAGYASEGDVRTLWWIAAIFALPVLGLTSLFRSLFESQRHAHIFSALSPDQKMALLREIAAEKDVKRYVYLRTAMSDNDADIRQLAAISAGQTGSKRLLPALFFLAQAENMNLREIGLANPQVEAAARKAMEDIRSRRTGVRLADNRNLLVTVTTMLGAAASFLKAILTSPESAARPWAILGGVFFAVSVGMGIFEAVSSKKDIEAFRPLDSAGKIKKLEAIRSVKSSTTVSILTMAMGDEDPDVRLKAAQTAGRVRSETLLGGLDALITEETRNLSVLGEANPHVLAAAKQAREAILGRSAAARMAEEKPKLPSPDQFMKSVVQDISRKTVTYDVDREESLKDFLDSRGISTDAVFLLSVFDGTKIVHVFSPSNLKKALDTLLLPQQRVSIILSFTGARLAGVKTLTLAASLALASLTTYAQQAPPVPAPIIAQAPAAAAQTKAELADAQIVRGDLPTKATLEQLRSAVQESGLKITEGKANNGDLFIQVEGINDDQGFPTRIFLTQSEGLIQSLSIWHAPSLRNFYTRIVKGHRNLFDISPEYAARIESATGSGLPLIFPNPSTVPNFGDRNPWAKVSQRDPERFFQLNPTIYHRSNLDRKSVEELTRPIEPKQDRFGFPSFVRVPADTPRDLKPSGRMNDGLRLDERYLKNAQRILDLVSGIQNTGFISYTGHPAVGVPFAIKNISVYRQLATNAPLSAERILNSLQDWHEDFERNDGSAKEAFVILLEPSHSPADRLDVSGLPSAERLRELGISKIVLFNEDSPGPVRMDAFRPSGWDGDFGDYVQRLQARGVKVIVIGLNGDMDSQAEEQIIEELKKIGARLATKRDGLIFDWKNLSITDMSQENYRRYSMAAIPPFWVPATFANFWSKTEGTVRMFRVYFGWSKLEDLDRRLLEKSLNRIFLRRLVTNAMENPFIIAWNLSHLAFLRVVSGRQKYEEAWLEVVIGRDPIRFINSISMDAKRTVRDTFFMMRVAKSYPKASVRIEALRALAAMPGSRDQRVIDFLRERTDPKNEMHPMARDAATDALAALTAPTVLDTLRKMGLNTSGARLAVNVKIKNPLLAATLAGVLAVFGLAALVAIVPSIVENWNPFAPAVVQPRETFDAFDREALTGDLGLIRTDGISDARFRRIADHYLSTMGFLRTSERLLYPGISEKELSQRIQHMAFAAVYLTYMENPNFETVQLRGGPAAGPFQVEAQSAADVFREAENKPEGSPERRLIEAYAAQPGVRGFIGAVRATRYNTLNAKESARIQARIAADETLQHLLWRLFIRLRGIKGAPMEPSAEDVQGRPGAKNGWPRLHEGYNTPYEMQTARPRNAGEDAALRRGLATHLKAVAVKALVADLTSAPLKDALDPLSVEATTKRFRDLTVDFYQVDNVNAPLTKALRRIRNAEMLIARIENEMKTEPAKRNAAHYQRLVRDRRRIPSTVLALIRESDLERAENARKDLDRHPPKGYGAADFAAIRLEAVRSIDEAAEAERRVTAGLQELAKKLDAYLARRPKKSGARLAKQKAESEDAARLRAALSSESKNKPIAVISLTPDGDRSKLKDEIREAVAKQRPIEIRLDRFSSIPRAKDRLQKIGQALEFIAADMDRSLEKNLDLAGPLKELLNNAFYHGNHFDPSLPIFLRIFLTDRTIRVYDLASGRKISKAERSVLEFDRRLGGAHRALDEMENIWFLKRESEKSVRRRAAWTVSEIVLRPFEKGQWLPAGLEGRTAGARLAEKPDSSEKPVAEAPDARVDLERRREVDFRVAQINRDAAEHERFRNETTVLTARLEKLAAEREQASPVPEQEAESVLDSIEHLYRALRPYHPLLYMRGVLKANDQIVIFVQQSLKTLNDVLGQQNNNAVIAYRQQKLTELIEKEGLLRDEENGHLMSDYKQDEYAVLGDKDAVPQLQRVNDELSAAMDAYLNERFPAEMEKYRQTNGRPFRFVSYFGLSGRLKFVDDASIKLADLQARQSAKMARLLPRTGESGRGYDFRTFEALMTRAQVLAKELNLPGFFDGNGHLTPEAVRRMLAVRGMSELEVRNALPSEYRLKRFLDLVDLFDYPKAWVDQELSDPHAMGIDRNLKALKTVVESRSLPEDREGLTWLKERVDIAANYLRQNLKEPRFSEASHFHVQASSRFAESTILSADAVGFYASTTAGLMEAFRRYTESARGETNFLNKQTVMLQEAIRADDEVKLSMKRKTTELIGVLEKSIEEYGAGVSIARLQEGWGGDLRLGLREGGDEVVLFLQGMRSDPRIFTALARAAQQLGFRISISHGRPKTQTEYGLLFTEFSGAHGLQFIESDALDKALKAKVKGAGAESGVLYYDRAHPDVYTFYYVDPATKEPMPAVHLTRADFQLLAGARLADKNVSTGTIGGISYLIEWQSPAGSFYTGDKVYVESVVRALLIDKAFLQRTLNATSKHQGGVEDVVSLNVRFVQSSAKDVFRVAVGLRGASLEYNRKNLDAEGLLPVIALKRFRKEDEPLIKSEIRRLQELDGSGLTPHFGFRMRDFFFEQWISGVTVYEMAHLRRKNAGAAQPYVTKEELRSIAAVWVKVGRILSQGRGNYSKFPTDMNAKNTVVQGYPNNPIFIPIAVDVGTDREGSAAYFMKEIMKHYVWALHRGVGVALKDPAEWEEVLEGVHDGFDHNAKLTADFLVSSVTGPKVEQLLRPEIRAGILDFLVTRILPDRSISSSWSKYREFLLPRVNVATLNALEARHVPSHGARLAVYDRTRIHPKLDNAVQNSSVKRAIGDAMDLLLTARFPENPLFEESLNGFLRTTQVGIRIREISVSAGPGRARMYQYLTTKFNATTGVLDLHFGHASGSVSFEMVLKGILYAVNKPFDEHAWATPQARAYFDESTGALGASGLLVDHMLEEMARQYPESKREDLNRRLDVFVREGLENARKNELLDELNEFILNNDTAGRPIWMKAVYSDPRGEKQTVRDRVRRIQFSEGGVRIEFFDKGVLVLDDEFRAIRLELEPKDVSAARLASRAPKSELYRALEGRKNSVIEELAYRMTPGSRYELAGTTKFDELVLRGIAFIYSSKDEPSLLRSFKSGIAHLKKNTKDIYQINADMMATLNLLDRAAYWALQKNQPFLEGIASSVENRASSESWSRARLEALLKNVRAGARLASESPFPEWEGKSLLEILSDASTTVAVDRSVGQSGFTTRTQAMTYRVEWSGKVYTMRLSHAGQDRRPGEIMVAWAEESREKRQGKSMEPVFFSEDRILQRKVEAILMKKLEGARLAVPSSAPFDPLEVVSIAQKEPALSRLYAGTAEPRLEGSMPLNVQNSNFSDLHVFSNGDFYKIAKESNAVQGNRQIWNEITKLHLLGERGLEGIPRILEFGFTDTGRLWVKLNGLSSAESWTEADIGRNSLAEKLDALSRASEIFAGVHAAGLAHNDIRPENLLIDRSKRVMVIDFGAATLPGEKQAIAAPKPYRAPDRQQTSPASDVYSLGVLFVKTFYPTLDDEIFDDLLATQDPGRRQQILQPYFEFDRGNVSTAESLAKLAEAMLRRAPEERAAAGVATAADVFRKISEISSAAWLASPAYAPQRLNAAAANAQLLEKIVQQAAAAASREVAVKIEPVIFGDIRYLQLFDTYFQHDVDLALVYDDTQEDFQGFEQALKIAVWKNFMEELKKSAASSAGWRVSYDPDRPMELPTIYISQNGHIHPVTLEISPMNLSGKKAFFKDDRLLFYFTKADSDRRRVSGLLQAVYYLSEDPLVWRAFVQDFMEAWATKRTDWAAFMKRHEALNVEMRRILSQTPRDQIDRRIFGRLDSSIDFQKTAFPLRAAGARLASTSVPKLMMRVPETTVPLEMPATPLEERLRNVPLGPADVSVPRYATQMGVRLVEASVSDRAALNLALADRDTMRLVVDAVATRRISNQSYNLLFPAAGLNATFAVAAGSGGPTLLNFALPGGLIVPQDISEAVEKARANGVERYLKSETATVAIPAEDRVAAEFVREFTRMQRKPAQIERILAAQGERVVDTKARLVFLHSTRVLDGQGADLVLSQFALSQLQAIRNVGSPLGPENHFVIGRGSAGYGDFTLNESVFPRGENIQYVYMTDGKNIEASLREELSGARLSAAEIDKLVASTGIVVARSPLDVKGEMNAISNLAAAVSVGRVQRRIYPESLTAVDDRVIAFVTDMIPSIRSGDVALADALKRLRTFDPSYRNYLQLAVRITTIQIGARLAAFAKALQAIGSAA